MKKLVLMTAALLAGTALAAAQGMNAQAPTGGNKTESAAPAPEAQKNAPADKMAPAAQQKPAQIGGQVPKADADVKAGADSKMNAQKADDKNKAATGKMDDKSKASMDNKASADQKNGKASAQSDSKEKAGATTGQGAAGAKGAANLSTEQRTKIRTVIREKVKVQPLTHVNFSINVGTVVPRTVHFYPVPTEVIAIYPQWRGYNFILVGEQIIIIDPATYTIVEVIA